MRAVLKEMPAALAALCAAALAGCAPQPLLDPAAPTPPLALVPIAAAGISDGRARFREILCRLNEHHGATLPDHRPCEEILHRLPGEARPRARPVNLGRAALPLRLVIVPGLTAECFGALATPLPLAARHVEQLGYETSWVEVAGLASSAQNAAAVQAAIARLAEAADQPIVLLGYSKGIGDVLQAVTDPTTARRVTAVVSASAARSTARRSPIRRPPPCCARSPPCRAWHASPSTTPGSPACAAPSARAGSRPPGCRRRSATTRWRASPRASGSRGSSCPRGTISR
jgi:hypothetical protein